MKLSRRRVRDVLFCVCLAALAAAGAVEQLRRPQPVWLPLAAMACAPALFVPVRGQAWKPELFAVAFTYCALTAGGLSVAVRGVPVVGDAALRPAVIPILALGALALATRRDSRSGTSVWTSVLLAAAAAVAAGLCGGYILISRYHNVEASTARDALFNVTLLTAAWLTAAPFFSPVREDRFGSIALASAAFALLAACLAGSYA